MTSGRRQAALDLLGEAAREGQLAGRRFRVRGGCMAPLLVDGDEVELALETGPLLPGQIVLARAGAELLCHRLLAAGEDNCLVAGDTDLRLDSLPHDDVLGRVAAIATARFGGARLVLASKPSATERWLSAWHLWACQGRRRLQLRLEGLRRRLRENRADRLWQPSRLRQTPFPGGLE